MARKNQTVQICVKIPEGLIKILDDDINENMEFASRSEYIVCAIKLFETERSRILAERAQTKSLNQQHETDFISTPSSGLQDIKTK